MRYLTLSELVYINGVVLNDSQILSGKRQIREVELLDAAVARPAQSAFGVDAYSTLAEKVAALFHSVARNHPFTNGNKRTATLAAVFMFKVNGQCVVWKPEDALLRIVSVAEGHASMESLAAWFVCEPCEGLPEPDAERDKQIIARIIEDHRWLLDELAKR